MNNKLKGIVVWFCAKKGFGFLAPSDGGKDVFVHYKNILAEGYKVLDKDQQVEFELGENHKGVQAINVVVCGNKPE